MRSSSVKVRHPPSSNTGNIVQPEQQRLTPEEDECSCEDRMRSLLVKVKHPSCSNAGIIVQPEQSRNEDATENQTNTSPPLLSIFKGLLLSFLSGVMYSLCSVLVKYMKNIHPGHLAVYRFVAIITLSLPQVVKIQKNVFGPPDMRFLLVLRGTFGAMNIFLNFLAFRYLPLGEAAVIIFSAPIFVTIAARVFLKETCGIVQSIAVVITIVGVIFITKVPAKLSGNSVNYTNEYIYGLVASFASVIFSTCRCIVLRKVKSVHHSVTVFFSSLVSLLETVILTAIFGSFDLHECGPQQGLVILFGIFNYAGTTLFTVALQLEQAGPVSTMRAASDIILAFLWQMYIFRDTPDGFSIAGAFLVGFSVVLVGLMKWVSSLPSDSATAKRLRFLRK